MPTGQCGRLGFDSMFLGIKSENFGVQEMGHIIVDLNKTLRCGKK